MKTIINIVKKLEIISYIIISILVILATYDFFNDSRIKKFLIFLFCKDTVGDCFFGGDEIYNSFNSLGILVYLFLPNGIWFIIGQVFQLIFYLAICWFIFFIIKIILNLISRMFEAISKARKSS